MGHRLRLRVDGRRREGAQEGQEGEEEDPQVGAQEAQEARRRHAQEGHGGVDRRGDREGGLRARDLVSSRRGGEGSNSSSSSSSSNHRSSCLAGAKRLFQGLQVGEVQAPRGESRRCWRRRSRQLCAERAAYGGDSPLRLVSTATLARGPAYVLSVCVYRYVQREKRPSALASRLSLNRFTARE